MKTKEELKRELHEYIDSITDEETLFMFHEEVSAYLKKDAETDDEELTEEQEKELEEAIRQADAGETMNFDELKKEMEKWHTK